MSALKMYAKGVKDEMIAMFCYIFIFCIAGTLGNNQLPALVNNKQRKPSSRPSCLRSGQHFVLFLFFYFSFLKPLVNHFDTAEKC